MSPNHKIEKSIKQIVGNKRLSQAELRDAELFVNALNNDVDVNNWMDHNWEKASQKQHLYKTSYARIESQIKRSNKKTRIIELATSIAAAAVLIGVLITGWMLLDNETATIHSIAQKDQVTTELSNSNVILQTQGESFDLSHNKIDLIKDGLQIQGSKHQLKLKEAQNNIANNTDLKLQWNTLVVPRGKDYYVQLPDGTEVWINAGSKLKFPILFADNARTVELEGEAYFKVKSNIHHPFYVKTATETVRVTGTQFNVCSYSDEPNSRITLAEGKVSVIINNKEHSLIPGEQLLQSNSGSVNKQKVNVQLYTSWREGIFEFSDMSLDEISYRLSKWYDVDFKFVNANVAKQRFSGMTKKEYTLDYFLNVIEKTTNVKFVTKNKQIIVSEI